MSRSTSWGSVYIVDHMLELEGGGESSVLSIFNELLNLLKVALSLVLLLKQQVIYMQRETSHVSEPTFRQL